MTTPLLSSIKRPSDIKTLRESDLDDLAQEIREKIIDVMSVNGGHLASNLGSVEIIIALHRMFNSPNDRFIFDTSHQTYPHKLLTGRFEKFHTIRQFEGLCGFASPKESEHDHFYAGHAGTALSLALGLAKSRDLNQTDEFICPVIGDAALTCGLTLEAINNLHQKLKKFIIILNDNTMAISNNVGTIKGLLSQYNPCIRSKMEEFIQNPQRTAPFFEQFGLKYIGPVDGHDVGSLINALETAIQTEQPVILHALTVKGHGMDSAAKSPITYHGVKPFDPETGKFYPSQSTNPTFPKVFGQFVLEMATEDPHLVTITPAMPKGSCLDAFMEKFPDRCLDVGIAEGHAVTFAGGLAYKSNKKVIVSIYASFLQRALDNLFQDICLQELPVVLALDRGGIAGPDGSTHNGIYDIAFLNAMPSMVIAQPRNGDLLKDLLYSAFDWNLPTAIRYPNMQTEVTQELPIKRELGRGEILKEGKDIVILALGHMCNTALAVREELLEHNIEATVVDPIFVKPLDKTLLFKLLLDHNYFVTIEEHAVSSGFGSIINSFIMQSGITDVQTQNFGIPDQFVDHGKHHDLIEHLGLTPKAITKQILQSLSINEQIGAVT